MESDERTKESASATSVRKREDVEPKRLNDDLVVFMRKRSEHDAPRYTARLKTYVDFQQKRRRAVAARKRSEHAQGNQLRKKLDKEHKEKAPENSDRLGGDVGQMSRRGHGEKAGQRSRSQSGDESPEPGDCGCQRRRRRRSCCPRRRRRRRSCRRRRRSCRRRRRRRSRRRRRRSCRRRRRKCRRRRR